MKRTLIFTLLTFIFSASVPASNTPAANSTAANISPAKGDTKTIVIWPFDGENKFDAREKLYNTITNAVVKSGRFKALERIKIDKVLSEININKEDYTRMADELVQQGKILGARYCLFGSINTANVIKTRDTNSKGETVYRHECSISLDLRIVNVETGMVEVTETIQVGEGTYTYAHDDTQEGAWSEACEKICDKTEEFLKASFPQIIEIVKIESEKKGAAFEILIAAGSKQGMQKKDEIKIYDIEKIEVGGETKEREIHIATMIIKEVESEDFSICKVTSGGGKLKSRIENGSPILCKALAKRTIDILKF